MPNNRIKSQHKKGSILVIACVCFCLLVILGMLVLWQYQFFMLDRQKGRYGAEASALVAATSLSSIVIADENWGYVSLSDHPPCGTITRARDNQPLPITGINTIIATVRLEKLLAKQLHNDALTELANEDYQKCKKLQQRLQSALLVSLKPSDNFKPKDMYGKSVDVYKGAYQTFLKNYPDAKIKSFSIALGWIKNGSTTVTPDAERKVVVGESSDCYPSFVNVPVGSDDFYFAGVADQVRLIDASRFAPADDKHFSSCILIKAEIDSASNEKDKAKDKNNSPTSLLVQSCALPYSEHNNCAAGSLALYMPQGGVKEISNLSDIICAPEMKEAGLLHCTANQDYPVAAESALVPEMDQPLTADHYMAKAFFDWLKSCHARSSLESIMKAVNSSFDSSGNMNATSVIITFRPDLSGAIHLDYLSDSSYPVKIVPDKQTCDSMDAVLPTAKGLVFLTIRDAVAYQGIMPGSQHGGQPISSELPSNFSKFPSLDQHSDDLTRDSYRQGGVAVAIEIGYSGTGRPPLSSSL